MNDCVFCKIISGEWPSFRIYEDELVVGFLSKFPIIQGHALIVPKKHYKDFLEMDTAISEAVMKAGQLVGKNIMNKLGVEGFNFANNQGTAAGQEIMHVHFHIIPRKNDDNLPEWENHEVSVEEMKKIAEKLNK